MMNKRSNLLALSFTVSALASCLRSGEVWAQASADQQAPADQTVGQRVSADQTTFEEVVIRGRKPLIDTHNVNVGAFGSKDVMDIPIDIDSYSSALIDNQLARTLDDVVRNDPAVAIADIGGAYDDVRIRGFFVDWFNTMRRDGLSQAPYQDVPLEMIDRVDILKGPSGFLYGFNAPGGTINFITKQPTKDPFDEVTVQWRSFDGRYAHIDTSHSLGTNGDFGYRANLAYEQVGDFSHSGDLERRTAGASILWRITDRAVLALNGDWQKKDIAAQPVIGLQPNNTLPPMIDPRTLLGQQWFKYRANTASGGARLDYSLNTDWYVVGQVAYSSNKRDAAFVDIYQVNANGDIPSGDLVLSPGQPYSVTSAQLFLSGKFNTSSIRHELVTGFSARSYAADESGYATLTTMTNGNLFHPVYFPEITIAQIPPKTHSVNHQTGPFASDLITLSDSWQALLGARYVHYSNTQTRPAAAPVPYVKNSFVPSFGLIYKPVAQVMGYFNYSEGLEQGDYAPFFTKNAGTALNPLVSRQYEVGVKSRLHGDLTLGLAAFEIRKTLEFVNGNNVFVQSGLQRHRGIALTTTGEISSNTTLIAGVEWLNATQVDTGDPTVNGKRTEDVPEWEANLYVDTRIPAIHGLSVDAGVNFVGNRAVGPQNVAFIPSYTRFDLGLRYLTKLFNRNLIFRAGVKNVTDKLYWSSAEYTSVYPGQPRIAYVSMSADFL